MEDEKSATPEHENPVTPSQDFEPFKVEEVIPANEIELEITDKITNSSKMKSRCWKIQRKKQNGRYSNLQDHWMHSTNPLKTGRKVKILYAFHVR